MSHPDTPMPIASACPSCGRPLPAPGALCLECAPTLTPPGGAAAAADEIPASLKRIAGFTLLRRLGAGGMGTVYEAYEEAMHRKVALKLIARQLARSEQAAQRFALEAWIGGRLNHPNLVKVYERGSFEDIDYYAMELVDGGSLADVITALKQDGRDAARGLAFGTREYVEWALRQTIAAARGLDAAHRQGVVHRDVKPMNLLLDREQGTVKVADFGLAIDADVTRLTTDGKMLGTPVYMAPEQILGKSRAIDARTDVYALGVTLFELLTLDLPYAGPTQALYLDAVLTQEARRPSRLNNRVGRDLEVVVRKALEKDPRDRYAAAGALADDLENVLNFRPIVARPPSALSRILKWVHRRPVHAVLLGLLLVTVPTVTVLWKRSLEHAALLRQQRLAGLEADLRLQRQRSRYPEMRATASEILAMQPGHVEARRYRSWAAAEVSLADSDPLRAETLRNEALQDSARLIEMLPGSPWPLRFRAFILKKLGRDEEAREAEARAAALPPSEPTDADLFFEALLAGNRGNHDLAIALTTRAYTRNPGNVEAITLRGDAFEALRKFDLAIKDYRIAVALNPDDFDYNRVLARLLDANNDPDQAEEFFKRALALAPPGARGDQICEIHLVLGGRALLRRDDRKGAGEHFERGEAAARACLAAHPHDLNCRVSLSVALMRRNKLLDKPDPAVTAEVVRQYETVVKTPAVQRTHPDDVRAWETAVGNLCDALIETRDLERALPACLEVTRQFPDSATAFYNLAGVHALSGRKEEALASLKKDVELGDTDHEYLASDPWFASLRGEPRFKALLQKMRQAGSQ